MDLRLGDMLLRLGDADLRLGDMLLRVLRVAERERLTRRVAIFYYIKKNKKIKKIFFSDIPVRFLQKK